MGAAFLPFFALCLFTAGGLAQDTHSSITSVDVQLVGSLSALFSADKTDKLAEGTTLQLVPQQMQDALFPDLKLALQEEKVVDFKAELQSVLQLQKSALRGEGADSLEEMKQLMEQAAPGLAKLCRALISLLKKKYAEFKSKLDAKAQQFVAELENLLQQKCDSLQMQIETKFKALDFESKQSVHVYISASASMFISSE